MRVKLDLWDAEQKERLELSIESGGSSDDFACGTLYRENQQPIEINSVPELKELMAKGNFLEIVGLSQKRKNENYIYRKSERRDRKNNHSS